MLVDTNRIQIELWWTIFLCMRSFKHTQCISSSHRKNALNICCLFLLFYSSSLVVAQEPGYIDILCQGISPIKNATTNKSNKQEREKKNLSVIRNSNSSVRYAHQTTLKYLWLLIIIHRKFHRDRERHCVCMLLHLLWKEKTMMA